MKEPITATKTTTEAESALQRQKWQPIEYVGLVLLIVILACIFFFDKQFSGMFDAMFTRAYKMFEFYLFGASKLGAAIVVSVMTGRVLERLGLTDALMRLFLPIMKVIKVNAAVVVGVIYNILGDVNAAGRIAGPVVMKARCTRDEQKIAIATMCNAPCSFSIIVLGIIALSAAGINPLPVMIVGIFLPIVLVPALLKIFWRDTKAAEIKDLPRFTPNTSAIDTLFGSAREGAQLVFLFILPAGCVVFALIGIMEYFGIWPVITDVLGSFFSMIGIEPMTGVDTIMTAGTLAMKNLGTYLTDGTIIATTAAVKKLIVGSFIHANSAWPIQVPLGQIPAVWSGVVDLKNGEIMRAALIGCFLRLIYAAVVAQIFGLFF